MIWIRFLFTTATFNFKITNPSLSTLVTRIGYMEFYFKKNKDYYLASMSCFIEITNDLSEQQHYGKIIKISELSNKILKNGVEHLYDEKSGELKTVS